MRRPTPREYATLVAAFRHMAQRVADLERSRESMRKIRIFQEDAYISIDYQERKITILRRGGEGLPVPGLPQVTMAEKRFEEGDPLQAEIASFIDAVHSGGQPVVGGEEGKRALEVALKINHKLWHEVTG